MLQFLFTLGTLEVFRVLVLKKHTPDYLLSSYRQKWQFLIWQYI